MAVGRDCFESANGRHVPGYHMARDGARMRTRSRDALVSTSKRFGSRWISI